MHKINLTAFHYNLINDKKNIYNTTQFSFSAVVSVKELTYPFFLYILTLPLAMDDHFRAPAKMSTSVFTGPGLNDPFSS